MFQSRAESCDKIWKSKFEPYSLQQSRKTQKKLKWIEMVYQNAIYPVFLDIAKFPDFPWKKADVSRTQGVYHVIHIIFGSSFGKV